MIEPNLYIKKYGIEQAKNFYERIKNKPMYSFNSHFPEKYKKFIEAHDLVEKIGGLEKAKQAYSRTGWIIGDHKLEQAIADVESCQ